jgi:hypothetical protein
MAKYFNSRLVSDFLNKTFSYKVIFSFSAVAVVKERKEWPVAIVES